jgi:putative phosphoribosyl transferase
MDSSMSDGNWFRDRTSAGDRLAARLAAMDVPDPVVLALPRGGVPVARQIAAALKAPLDLLLVRKIGVPWQPELAAAAIVDGEHPDVVYNDEVMALAGLTRDQLASSAESELREIERRRQFYLSGRAPAVVEGRTAIVVDDGIATGTTMRAALIALRRRRPSRLILAVPVAPEETLEALRPLVDDAVCLATPDPFGAIGAFYLDFHQLTDDEVVHLLSEAADRTGAAGRVRPT